jgi:hypothetical protein
VPEYRAAARRAPRHFHFQALTPNVGVCWSNACLRASSLRRIERTVQRHAAELEPDEVGAWCSVLLQPPHGRARVLQGG